jgi:hypothetical protein
VIAGTLAASADFHGSDIDGELVLGPLTLASVLTVPGLALEDTRVRLDLRVNKIKTHVWPAPTWAARPLKIRTAELTTYPEWRLAEALFSSNTSSGKSSDGRPDTGSDVAILAFLYRPTDLSIFVLNGESNPIHDLNGQIHDRNEQGALSLGTSEQAEEYLSLFCNYVWGNEGAFRIVVPDGPTSERAPNGPTSERAPDGPTSERAPDGPTSERAPDGPTSERAPDGPTSEKAPIVMGDPEPGPDGARSAVATIAFGSDLFEATFRIDTKGEAKGNVEMTDDRPIGKAPDGQPIRYDTPVRWVQMGPQAPGRSAIQWPVPQPVKVGTSWTEVDESECDRIWTALKPYIQPAQSPDPPTTLAGNIPRFKIRLSGLKPTTLAGNIPRFKIGLSGLKVGSLNDADGRNWFGDTVPAAGNERAPVLLDLNGFEYDRIDQTRLRNRMRQRLDDRKAWLKAQYENPDKVSEGEYEPQPFEQLAKVWRAEGNDAAAGDITFAKLALERVVFSRYLLSGWKRRMVFAAGVFILLMVLLDRVILGLTAISAVGDAIIFLIVVLMAVSLPTGYLKYLLFEVPFGYGLRINRALGTFFALWVIGSVLVIAGTFVPAGVAAGSPNSGDSSVMVIDASSVGTVASNTAGNVSTVVPVGQIANGQPEIPCRDHIDPPLYALDVLVPLLDLRQEQRCTVSALGGSWFWRLVKVIYAVLGWIVVTGLVLTASGVVRRQVEK